MRATNLRKVPLGQIKGDNIITSSYFNKRDSLLTASLITLLSNPHIKKKNKNHDNGLISLQQFH